MGLLSHTHRWETIDIRIGRWIKTAPNASSAGHYNFLRCPCGHFLLTFGVPDGYGSMELTGRIPPRYRERPEGLARWLWRFTGETGSFDDPDGPAVVGESVAEHNER